MTKAGQQSVVTDMYIRTEYHHQDKLEAWKQSSSSCQSIQDHIKINFQPLLLKYSAQNVYTT